MNTLASYGQLVGAPSYDDSILFERNEDHGDPGSAAGGDRRPVMKISVTDPVKKVGPGLWHAHLLHIAYFEIAQHLKKDWTPVHQSNTQVPYGVAKTNQHQKVIVVQLCHIHCVIIGSGPWLALPITYVVWFSRGICFPV